MMSEAKTKADLVRDYGESEAHKSFLAQIDTTVDEETLFQSALEEGRDQTQKYSEIQKAKSWYDCVGMFIASIDESHDGGKLLKEFAKKKQENVRTAVIAGADLFDVKVYTEFDWKRLALAQRRELKKFVDACAVTHEPAKEQKDNMNPYSKPE
jgi:hypothetical protein